VKTAKRTVKKALKTVKGSVKKATKAVAKKAKKVAAPLAKKVAASSKSKSPAKKAPKKAAPAKTAKALAKPTKKAPVRNIKKAPVAKAKAQPKQETPTYQRPRGKDMHFIPSHQPQIPTTVNDSVHEEKLFHHDEEVALHQENEKIKNELANNLDSKGNFHNEGGA